MSYMNTPTSAQTVQVSTCKIGFHYVWPTLEFILFATRQSHPNTNIAQENNGDIPPLHDKLNIIINFLLVQNIHSTRIYAFYTHCCAFKIDIKIIANLV